MAGYYRGCIHRDDGLKYNTLGARFQHTFFESALGPQPFFQYLLIIIITIKLAVKLLSDDGA